MQTCDLMLYEHREQGHTRCPTDPDHTAALERRRGGAAAWSRIVPGQDAGGDRDHLDGRPIHAGVGLLLQVVTEEEDDYGGYTLAKDEGVRVRYERSGKTITLYASVGGHEAIVPYFPSMRFRWPVRG